MTQAAVSYQIKELERRIGHALFLREKGGVRLTEWGQRLLPAVSGAFAEMRTAFSALGEEDNSVLAITAPVSLGSAWLTARIGKFQAAYPELAVRLSLSNRVADLVDGEFDVALRIGRGNWPGLRSDFLFRSHVTPIGSRETIEREGMTQPRDLLDAVRLSPDDPLWAGWFAATGVTEPPKPRPGIALDNQAQEVGAALAGHGIALLTPFLWRAELESGRLVQPFAQLYCMQTSNWFVWPEARRGVRKIERFREWLLAEIAAELDLLPPPLRDPP